MFDTTIPQKKIEAYRKEVIKSITNDFDTKIDEGLIADEIIIQAIQMHRDPKDIAWALIQ